MQVERLHPFDSRKFGKVMTSLERDGFFSRDQVCNSFRCMNYAVVLTNSSVLSQKKLTIHFIALMQLAESKEATQEMLLDVHTQEYLDRLNTSSAAIASVRTAGLKPDLL